MEKTIKLELGKSYKTVGGEKVSVKYVMSDKKSFHCVCTEVEDKYGYKTLRLYSYDGAHPSEDYSYSKKVISEWVGPREWWMAYNPDCRAEIYKTREDAENFLKSCVGPDWEIIHVKEGEK